MESDPAESRCPRSDAHRQYHYYASVDVQRGVAARSIAERIRRYPSRDWVPLVDGVGGRGLVFQMSLPPREFEATSSPAIREHVHRFRRDRQAHSTTAPRHSRLTASQYLDRLQPPRMHHRINRGGQDEYEHGRHSGPQRQRQHTPFDLDAVVHR